MFRFAPYILKTMWRHRARTMLTLSGAAVAVFVYCWIVAVQFGIDDLHRQQASQRSLIVFQANKFCPATSHLPQDYASRIERIDGVRDAIPIQVFTNNCRASLDVVVFYGLPADELPEIRTFEMVTGGWADFDTRQDAAVVGQAVARRRNIARGDRFSLGELTVRVAGVYTCEDKAEENYIYTHLDFLQRGRGWNRTGTVTQFEVRLDPAADATGVAARIDEEFRRGPIATSTKPKGVFQASSLGDLAALIALAHYLGYACIGVLLTLVATTTVMSVEDRVQEHAVLGTIGFSAYRLFALVLAESILLSFIGGLTGVAAATVVLHFSQLAVGAEAVTVAIRPSLHGAATGLGIATVTGILAGVLPAWQASHAEIVPALRQA